MDRFSPVAPARVRVLLLPVGQVEEKTFQKLLDQLNNEASIILLRDLTVTNDDDKFTLSPTKSPQGSILLNYTSADTAEQARQLSPFELWRESLLVIGVAAGLSKDAKEHADELKKATTELHERHSRVVHRQLLVLEDDQISSNDDIIYLQDGEQRDVMPVMQQIVVRFLKELSTYLTAMQASPSIQTPGQTSQGMLRAMMLREDDGRPLSRQGTPVEPRSPSGEENTSRPPSQDIMPPPTTFDQIPAANALGRSDSNTSHRSKSRPRTTSFDRVPIHNLSKDKLHDRGKARVGIVAGSIYLMAGHWSEALKVLIESTTRLRSLKDHIWNGKGLELIVVCLLLQLWAGLDVQVPAICFQLSDKVRDRLSKSFAADLAQKLVAPQSSMERVSSSLQNLSKHVLLLYHSIEGNIELPYTVVAEATVRFCKLLACVQVTNGVLTEHSISWVVEHQAPFVTSLTWSSAAFQAIKPLTKASISDMLSNALPLSDESITLAEHINILTGIASVYAILKMDRKKAITLKALVARLTAALNQARKLGAAEMGIHPSATLSAENGSEALLSSVQHSTGLAQLAQSLASVYGVPVGPQDVAFDLRFGSKTLQIDILRDLLKLCEASPDLEGISQLVVAFMTSAGQQEAVDMSSTARAPTIPPDEQARLLGMFHKASWLCEQLHITSPGVSYWDPFIMRGIELVGQTAASIIKETASDGAKTNGISSNPLLYDPNAPRPVSAKTKIILSKGENARFQISLQNPFDVPIDIEQLSIVSEGLQLVDTLKGARLRPGSIDRIVLETCPDTVGNATLTGCRIKVAGCTEQGFKLTPLPWKDASLPSMKQLGQDALHLLPSHKFPSPEHSTVTAEVVDTQPMLRIVQDQAQDAPMLLEGESQPYQIVLRNVSSVSATIIAVSSQSNNIACKSELVNTSIAPGQQLIVDFRLEGDPTMTHAHTSIRYASSTNSSHSRTCVVQTQLHVKPALRVTHVEVDAGTKSALSVTIDLFNCWHKPLQYTCGRAVDDAPKQKGILAAGDATRVQLDIEHLAQLQRTDSATLRNGLLDDLRIAWTIDSRSGVALLTDVALSERSLSLLKAPAVAITLAVVSDKQPVVVGSFITVRATFTAVTAMTEPQLVQLRQIPQAVVPERHTMLGGSLTKVVPMLTQGQETTIDFMLCPLATGRVVLDAVLRPALAAASDPSAEIRSANALTLTVTGQTLR